MAGHRRLKIITGQQERRDADIKQLQLDAEEAQRRLQTVEDDTVSIAARLDDANIPASSL